MQLPPLAWLRAFAEAGRYESFKQAAEAMHVTPSTVSHEIRNLEAWLSVPLFHRKGRGLELSTTTSQRYAWWSRVPESA
ncbi:MAG: LysR family transcriptional regulator [Proteobacteria bacterium]|nr:LysR family transcriptional regulator [Pseudomonadota bacterium]